MFTCSTCNFTLYNPLLETPTSFLGLYDDARFPGRSILMLKNHEEHYEDLPEQTLSQYTKDITATVRLLKRITGSTRINIALLGNSVPHVHAHLIPRYPEQETFPGKSPWNDPRKLSSLPLNEKQKIMTLIQNHYHYLPLSQKVEVD